jgi:hypothetical protein
MLVIHIVGVPEVINALWQLVVTALHETETVAGAADVAVAATKLLEA